jgi:1,2-diacylglycerol 3-beta-galactosyltransferase
VEQKSVLVLTSDAGHGHRSAAEAISAALEERHAGECHVEICNPALEEGAPEILRDSEAGYDRVIEEMPQLYATAYDFSDAKWASTLGEAISTVVLFQTIRTLIRRHQPHAIVTTYPLFQGAIQAVTVVDDLRTPLITVVTDLVTVHSTWFSGAADLCIVPTDEVLALALDQGIHPTNVERCGIPVHPAIAREQRTPSQIRNALGWREDTTTLLCVGGGSAKAMLGVIQGLNHASLPIQLAVVAGADEALHRTLADVEWHIEAKVYGYVPNLHEMMHAADAIICKAGGLIVSESLACGLPLLLIDALPGQEEGNAAYVKEGGAGVLARRPTDVLEIVYHWLERGGGLLARCAGNAQKLGRPHAAYEVAEHVWSTMTTDWRQRSRDRNEFGLDELVDLISRQGVALRT